MPEPKRAREREREREEGEKRRDATGYRLASVLTGPSGPVGMKEGRKDGW
jgi:hypothetical protein